MLNQSIRVRLTLGFGLYKFVLHFAQKDCLNLVSGEILRQTFLRCGENLLGSHIGGDDFAENWHNLRTQFCARLGIGFFALSLGFLAGLARLGNLVANLGEDFYDFGGVFNVHGDGVDSDVQSINASDSVLHISSLSGLMGFSFPLLCNHYIMVFSVCQEVGVLSFYCAHSARMNQFMAYNLLCLWLFSCLLTYIV